MEMPNIQALGLSNSQGGQGGPSGSNPLAGMAGMNIGALPMNPALVAAALNQVQQELKRKLIISSMLLLELLLQFVFSLVVVAAATATFFTIICVQNRFFSQIVQLRILFQAGWGLIGNLQGGQAGPGGAAAAAGAEHPPFPTPTSFSTPGGNVTTTQVNAMELLLL